MQLTGVLNITVLKGKNFSRSDWFGDSDPYVKIDPGFATELQTFVADVNSEGEAIWNEKLIFSANTDSRLDSLKITVLDKDAYGEDEVLFSQTKTLQNYTLDSEKLELFDIVHENGLLTIVVHYIPLTVLQKIYAKLGNVAEYMKERMISQLMTVITRNLPFSA